MLKRYVTFVVSWPKTVITLVAIVTLGLGFYISRLRVLLDVVVPSALPELLNGIRSALALSFVLLVSSELIVARKGLGYLIGFLGEGGLYDAMFAVVLLVAFTGFFADRIYQAFANRVLAWRD